MEKYLEETKKKVNTQFKLLVRNLYNQVEEHIKYIERRMDTTQNFRYKVQEVMIGEEDLNALDKWISITKEKMM